MNCDVLSESTQGSWLIKNQNQTYETPEGHYAFVITASGSCHLWSMNDSKEMMYFLRDEFADIIHQAGEINFKTHGMGKRLSWKERTDDFF